MRQAGWPGPIWASKRLPDHPGESPGAHGLAGRNSRGHSQGRIPPPPESKAQRGRPQRTVLGSRTEPVNAVAIAPDGAWLAAAGRDQTLRIWDLATRKVCAVMKVDSPLHECAWNRHGTLLAAAGDAGLYLFSFNRC
jgi:WD40 repeat protein